MAAAAAVPLQALASLTLQYEVRLLLGAFASAVFVRALVRLSEPFAAGCFAHVGLSMKARWV